MSREEVCLISLGCPKNLIDSEVILGLLVQKGYGVTDKPAEADILVINTCTFVKDATQEALDTVVEAAHLKRSGSCRLLIVTGCLPQRYGDELAKEIPEVDFFLGTETFPRIIEYIDGKSQNLERVSIGRTGFLYDHQTPRLLSGPSYTAYVKIAEGCSRSCSFCIVPKLRGRFRSRPIFSIREEVDLLVEQGVKEINLVAQDTTSYGVDLNDGTTLVTLLGSLCAIDGLEWIRILYAFPDHIGRDLLRAIRHSGKTCNYLDLPIQHISEEILRAMGRPTSLRAIGELIQEVREEIPGVCLRTTLMVGFPGETERQFSELYDFVKRSRFERLGIFEFSPEEGTSAAKMKRQVSRSIKRRRFERLMELQQQISLEQNRTLIGRTVPVLVEGPLGQIDLWKGRMANQAPEIDGHVVIAGGTTSPGQLVDVVITEAQPYDLRGTIRKGS
jgi:ribosomal protein S12 methylthiotransferase